MRKDLFQYIPCDLVNTNAWVNWNPSRGKAPINPQGIGVDKTNPANWSSFEEVKKAPYAGIGFCLNKDQGFVVIDLDDCVIQCPDEPDAWKLKPHAARIYQKLGSYTEFSPSGKGIHIWVRAFKPEGGRTKVVVDGEQIEVYHHNAYVTCTGDVVGFDGIMSRQEAIDWLHEEYLTPDRERADLPKGLTRRQSPLADDAKRLDKARWVIQVAEPAISGQQGGTQTYKVAQQLVKGCGLDFETAMMFMHDYNEAKCHPPWTERELERKVNEAIHKSRVPDDFLFTLEKIEQMNPEVIVDLKTVSGATTADESPLEWQDIVDKAPMFLRDTINWILDTSNYRHPAFATAAALATWGTALGRRVRDIDDTRTNLYLAIVAETSSGKDWPFNAPARILSRAEGGEVLVGVTDLGSRLAFQRHLAKYPCQLFSIDEVDGLLGNMTQSHMKGLPEDFKRLWSSANNRRWKGAGFSDYERTVTIDQPHACILGTSTPSNFYQTVSQNDVTGGLISRFLVFESDEPYPERNKGKKYDAPPEWVVGMLGAWIGSSYLNYDLSESDPLMVNYTDEARAMVLEDIDAYRNAMREMVEDNDEQSFIMGKASENVLKLALIAGCAKPGPLEHRTIKPADAQWAIDVVRVCVNTMIKRLETTVAESKFERQLKQVLAWGRAKHFVSPADIARRFRSIRKRDLDEIIGCLVQTGDCKHARIEETEEFVLAFGGQK